MQLAQVVPARLAGGEEREDLGVEGLARVQFHSADFRARLEQESEKRVGECAASDLGREFRATSSQLNQGNECLLRSEALDWTKSNHTLKGKMLYA